MKGARVRIGRNEGNDLVLSSQACSRYHAEIVREGDAYRIVDLGSNQELARYDLSDSGDHTGQVMAKLYRHAGEWKLHAIGESTAGRTFQDMLPAIRQNL